MVKKVVIDKANRLHQMPPHVLAFADTVRRRLRARGDGLIDLASFVWPVDYDPGVLSDESVLQPVSETRLAELKEELAGWLSRRYRIKVSAERELFVGGSVASMVYQLTTAFVDVGDVAFVPGLGEPLYRSAVTASDGEPIGYSISAKTGWMPQFDRLSTGLGRVARLLFLNSPHNPTGSTLSEQELAELVWQAGKENVFLVNDASLAGLLHHPPASLIGITGGKRVGVELYSFSHLLGLPCLPFGFAAGNRELISGLKRLERFLPAHLPGYCVDLAVEGLRRFPGRKLQSMRERVKTAAAPADRLAAALGLEPSGTPGVPFLWARSSKRTPSATLARTLLKRHKILVAPGTSFGETGEGYVRCCLLAGEQAFSEALQRMEKRRTLRSKGSR